MKLLADLLARGRVGLEARGIDARRNSQVFVIREPDTPMLGIWQKPGAPFLCIEPWQGIADPIGFAGDFRDKPGVVELAPGASRTFRLSITVNPPENRP